MKNEKALIEKQGTGWNGWKRWYGDAVEMLEWLSAHGYKATRAGKAMNGKRVCYFNKPGCKTTYAIYC